MQNGALKFWVITMGYFGSSSLVMFHFGSFWLILIV